MTRIRVLIEARRLIERGYLPHRKNVLATDAVGNNVSVFHPKAVNFTLLSAVKRAVQNTTGEPFDVRKALYEEASLPLYAQFPSVLAFNNYFATASVEDAVSFINNVLEGFKK